MNNRHPKYPTPGKLYSVKQYKLAFKNDTETFGISPFSLKKGDVIMFLRFAKIQSGYIKYIVLTKNNDVLRIMLKSNMIWLYIQEIQQI